GFVAGVRTATVQGPDFGATFVLNGTVDLDLNTTGAEVVLDGIGPIAGTPGSTYIRAEVTGADLQVAGSSLLADTLTFTKDGDNVTVAGSNVTFELKAGETRIVGVKNATFAMRFTSAGFAAAVRN